MKTETEIKNRIRFEEKTLNLLTKGSIAELVYKESITVLKWVLDE